MAGVAVPLHASEHFYIVTEPMAGVTPDLPVLRDTDGYIYVREEVGGLLMGGFEPVAKPWGMDGHPRRLRLLACCPEDWEHFQVLMEQALIRIPPLETAPVRRHVNGPESFTPGRPIPAGRGAGVPQLLRRGRLQLDRHRLRGGRRPGGGRVDRGRRAADGSLGRRHPPRRRRSRATRAICATAPSRWSGALYAMHWPFLQPETARGRAQERRCTTGSPRGAPASAP